MVNAAGGGGGVALPTLMLWVLAPPMLASSWALPLTVEAPAAQARGLDVGPGRARCAPYIRIAVTGPVVDKVTVATPLPATWVTVEPVIVPPYRVHWRSVCGSSWVATALLYPATTGPRAAGSEGMLNVE